MTGTQILALVRAEIKDSGNTKISDANALLAVNKGIRAINEELILWDASELVGTKATLTITAATDYVALPSDFKTQQFVVLERQESSLWKNVGTLDIFDDWWGEYYKSTSGQPAYYRIKDVNIYLRPVPNALYPYRLIFYYYKKLTELTALTESIPLSGAIDDVVTEYLKLWAILTLEKVPNFSVHLQDIVKARVFNIVSLRKPTLVEGGSLINTANWEI